MDANARLRNFMVTASSAMLFSYSTYAASPWIIDPGRYSLSATTVFESFEDFYRGPEEVPFPKEEASQQTLWLGYERGIAENWQIGLTTGYVESDAKAPNSETFYGLADTKLSFKYMFLDEHGNDGPFSMSVQVGAIFAGNYDRSRANQPHAPGDKADGLEVVFPMSKKLGSVYLNADIGYRWRNNDVPDDIFGSIGLGVPFTNRFMGTLKVAEENGRDGLDIAGPGFTPTRFHQTQEDRTYVEIGSYFIINARFSLYGGLAQVIDGRNTGKSDIGYLGIEWTP